MKIVPSGKPKMTGMAPFHGQSDCITNAILKVKIATLINYKNLFKSTHLQ